MAELEPAFLDFSTFIFHENSLSRPVYSEASTFSPTLFPSCSKSSLCIRSRIYQLSFCNWGLWLSKCLWKWCGVSVGESGRSGHFVFGEKGTFETICEGTWITIRIGIWGNAASASGTESGLSATDVCFYFSLNTHRYVSWEGKVSRLCVPAWTSLASPSAERCRFHGNRWN